MKSLLFSAVLVLTAPVFLATSCDRGKCPPDVACTEIFVMVTVKVTDQQGNPVKLDEAYAIRKDNGETIRPEQSMDGMYVVLDDSYQRKMPRESHTFHFVGKKDGKTVIDEPYLISADCCHISKLNGKEEIVY